ncbi:MAG: ribosome biogenesis GTP-binding protein YsxC [Elusimicrobia bacterium]|nr:ribosome biogenesis GTP-binding protein YsxC [Elusimicrobiota bacterium]
MRAAPFSRAAFVVSESDPARLPFYAAEIAFVGRSNVGKSSLINALLRKDLARTSSTPGRTRTINLFSVSPQAAVVDLPGYGFARGSPEERAGWGAMIEGYLTRRPSLRRVYVLIDAKVGPTDLDRRMVVWLQAARLPWRAVATKADQVKPAQAAARRRDSAIPLGLTPPELGWISVVERRGVDELRAEAAQLLGEA